jgi:hypothetical protein
MFSFECGGVDNALSCASFPALLYRLAPSDAAVSFRPRICFDLVSISQIREFPTKTSTAIREKRLKMSQGTIGAVADFTAVVADISAECISSGSLRRPFPALFFRVIFESF